MPEPLLIQAIGGYLVDVIYCYRLCRCLEDQNCNSNQAKVIDICSIFDWTVSFILRLDFSVGFKSNNNSTDTQYSDTQSNQHQMWNFSKKSESFPFYSIENWSISICSEFFALQCQLFPCSDSFSFFAAVEWCGMLAEISKISIFFLRSKSFSETIPLWHFFTPLLAFSYDNFPPSAQNWVESFSSASFSHLLSLCAPSHAWVNYLINLNDFSLAFFSSFLLFLWLLGLRSYWKTVKMRKLKKSFDIHSSRYLRRSGRTRPLLRGEMRKKSSFFFLFFFFVSIVFHWNSKETQGREKMKSREEKLVKLFNSLIIQFTFGIAQDDERFLGFLGFSSHP